MPRASSTYDAPDHLRAPGGRRHGAQPWLLPILPAVLSAGATGGRRRPAGVVTGIVVAFTFATVALVYVIDGVGLPDDLVRWIAIGTLFVFGIVLLVPPLADRVEAFISRIVPGPARAKGEGFWPGFLLGNEPGPGLRALRRPDPGGGHHGLGLARLHRRQAGGGVRLRDRLRRRAACPHAWRAQAGGSDGLLEEPRPGRDGGPDGAHRSRDGRRARHPLPDDHRRRPAWRSSSIRPATSRTPKRLPAISPTCGAAAKARSTQRPTRR